MEAGQRIKSGPDNKRQVREEVAEKRGNLAKEVAQRRGGSMAQ